MRSFSYWKHVAPVFLARTYGSHHCLYAFSASLPFFPSLDTIHHAGHKYVTNCDETITRKSQCHAFSQIMEFSEAKPVLEMKMRGTATTHVIVEIVERLVVSPFSFCYGEDPSAQGTIIGAL